MKMLTWVKREKAFPSELLLALTPTASHKEPPLPPGQHCLPPFVFLYPAPFPCSLLSFSFLILIAGPQPLLSL